ncbi:hypothetical protein [Streptomyces sp. NPDC002671]
MGDTGPHVEALTGQFTEAQDDLASIRVSLRAHDPYRAPNGHVEWRC